MRKIKSLRQKPPIKKSAAEKEAARVRKNERAKAMRREQRQATGSRTIAQYHAELAARAAERKRSTTTGQTREQYLERMAALKASGTLKRREPEAQKLIAAPPKQIDPIGYDDDAPMMTDRRLIEATDKFLKLLHHEALSAIRSGPPC